MDKKRRPDIAVVHDRAEFPIRVIGHLGANHRIERDPQAVDGAQDMAVGRGPRAGFAGDHAVRPDAVFHHEGLGKHLSKHMDGAAREDINRAAGRRADENSTLPGRIGLRARRQP